MTRRRFGFMVAGTAVGLACGRTHLGNGSGAPANPTLAYADPATVVLAGVPRGENGEATARAVRAAALGATDFSWLSRGDVVLIKPACNSGYAYPATTDPVAIAAMIGLLKEKGAGRILVAEMSGVQFLRFSEDCRKGSTRDLMRRAGIAEAAQSAGAELFAFEEAGWDAFTEERPELGASWQGPVAMPRILEEVDHVVLMPRCARHAIAGCTLGLKAAVGWWRHDTRFEYHRDATSLPEKTVDGNTVPSLLERQRLVVTSATRVLTSFGPDMGRVHEPETGIIIAAPSVVAHDMVSLAWLQENRRATRSSVSFDPHASALAADLINRIVTWWLGGLPSAMTAQRLQHRDLDRVWDDLVLRHAFALFGGVPRIELVDADGSVPRLLRERLGEAVSLPS